MNDIRIVIADDHAMVASAMQGMVVSFGCIVLYTVSNGKELLERFQNVRQIPDLVLLDINMPVMDGFATMKKLHADHPEVKVLCLSMNDDDRSFLRMIELGANGFISKMADEVDLRQAIDGVMKKGCYYTVQMADTLFRSMGNKKEEPSALLSDREKELLRYIGTEMTYVQIADKMCLSAKTIDGYRNALFQKLDIKSRTALAMFAVKEGYFKLK